MGKYTATFKTITSMNINIELTVQVIGPEKELEAIGENYAIYRRRLRLDLEPQMGMIISLKSNMVYNDDRINEFHQLMSTVEFKDLQLIIEKIIVEIGVEKTDIIRVRSADIIENTLNGFCDLGRLLIDFYGFERII